MTRIVSTVKLATSATLGCGSSLSGFGTSNEEHWHVHSGSSWREILLGLIVMVLYRGAIPALWTLEPIPLHARSECFFSFLALGVCFDGDLFIREQILS
jgi:hypothetical protein